MVKEFLGIDTNIINIPHRCDECFFLRYTTEHRPHCILTGDEYLNNIKILKSCPLSVIRIKED